MYHWITGILENSNLKTGLEEILKILDNWIINTVILENSNTPIVLLKYWNPVKFQYSNNFHRKYWNIGILEFWKISTFQQFDRKYWNVEILENSNMLYWDTGNSQNLQERFQNIGIPKNWVPGKFTYSNIPEKILEYPNNSIYQEEILEQ